MEQLGRVAHDQEMTKRGGWNNWVGWHFAVNRGRLIRFIDAHGLYLVVDDFKSLRPPIYYTDKDTQCFSVNNIY